ncbi:MAG TPA: CocE/NonD family hydrolase [Verrucomicrobiae bacterium]|nr:CocE/NonD family hydrolase [Verrucomicrobiae bacterium]
MFAPKNICWLLGNKTVCGRFALACVTAGLSAVASTAADKLESVDRAWFEENYTKHEFRIPMRDGIRLHTAVYTPKDVSTNYPIWMMRTPYGVGPYGVDAYPEPARNIKIYAREKFIFAWQDVRGRNGSEGEFVHVRPILTTKAGPRDIDESTDAWDTIDWLVKHVPNNNGRVGLSGISYPGFYAACGAIDSHPALKAVSPQAPVSDWFIGDDFHHNGALYLPHAFRFLQWFEQKLEKPTREQPKPFDFETPNGYEFYQALGSLANADERFFKGRIAFWNEMMQHGTYDTFWQERNVRPRLRNIHAAVLTVGGWFDAEDLFGALQVYRSIEQQNPGIFNALVMGPWAHGQWHGDDGHKLGHIQFRAKTSDFFCEQIELPFFKYFLKGGTNLDLPEAFVFETGTCQWRRYDAWPPKNTAEKTLYFHLGGKLSFAPPSRQSGDFDEYVSDPRKPVPFIPNIAVSMTREHMLDDQRFAAMRPDVLVYQTDVLEEDLTIAGPITPSLHVSTTGTDADWVVKLIDVYSGDYPNPDPNPTGVQMGGYQQLVRAEPMRGKFRNSYEKPESFVPDQTAKVEWIMPDAYHTFRRGHRIMVQVQSSWFPLVDLNPQTFCDIYHAKPEQFRKATQRVFRDPARPSGVRVRVLGLTSSGSVAAP